MIGDVDAFRDAIRAAGLAPPDVIEPGRFYRFPGAGKANGSTAGWCKQFPDGRGGIFGDFATGFVESWQAKHSRPLSLVEREAFRRNVAETKAKAETERAREHADAAKRAAERWQAATPANPAHPYLVAKGVQPHGIRQEGERLVIPLRDASGALHSLQFIDADGGKKFLTGGRVASGYCGIGKPNGTLCITEGFATGASVHEATGHAVAVAFNAGNLEPAAVALRAKYPELRIIVCADDDYRTEGNPGITKATHAALAVGGLLAVPDFGDNRPDGATDFNDLAQHAGAEAVARCVANARKPDVSEASPDAPNATLGDSWPEPQPLHAESELAPYPLDALPASIGDAVREVVAFVQCPPALAACSALSALSLAGQHLADVARDDVLRGPVSLFLLAVAESGERKTTCDGYFLAGLRDWEADTRERMKPDMARRCADFAAWEQRRDGIKARIKEAARKVEATKDSVTELTQVEAEKPEPLRVPGLLYGDVTPEALAWNLATGWPSAGVISSEAGIVLGSHGMKAESVMSNLALLNSLWDGARHRVDRRTRESFTLAGARLTMGLAAQPETVRQFMEGTKGLARGNGFAARFLITAPDSTQGGRLYRPSGPRHATAAFGARLRALLNMPGMTNGNGALQPSALTLDAPAFAIWRAFHDDTERELRPGGDMAQVRDVASKAADNVARLAALFHLFANGPGGRIGADAVTAAAHIVGWHLYAARAFLDDVAAPAEAVNARRLDAWLIDRCRMSGSAEVSRHDILNGGPNPVRNRLALDAALADLVEAGRIRQTERGRKCLVVVNPALLGVAP